MRFRKSMVSLLVCLLTVALTAQVAFAAPPAGKGSKKHGQFSDLAGNYYESVIRQMLDRGILSGDSDERFAPDRALTRQEAAVAFVRLLGLEDEAIARSDEALPFADASQINPDYRGHILVATEQGIMGGEGANFNPLGTLNRETVAVLLSRLLQLYGDKDLIEKVREDCDDEDEVDDWAISSVAALMSKGLMSAYEGRFNPKQAITKGMMAAILSRITGGEWKYKEVNPKLRSISGPILTVDATPPHASITIGKDKRHSDTYSMGLGVKVFLDGERAQLIDLNTGDQVRLTLNPVGHVLVINASSGDEVTPVPNTTVTGTVQSIINQGSTKALVIQQSSTVNTYVMASNAKATFKDWPNGTFNDILQGEKVTAKIVDNKIAEVLIEPTYTLDQGTVTAISDSAIAIERANETEQAYLLDDHMTLVISGDSSPKLADVHVGDRVDLRTRDNQVVVMQVNTGWTVTGTVSSLLNPTGSNRGVTVRLSDGSYQSYFLASNAVVTVKDYPNATFAHLQPGDKVSIRLVNGTVAQLQAEFVTTVAQGTVEALSSTGTKFVAVRLNNDAVQTCILAPYYTLTVEGRTNPTLSDIVVGDRIDVRLHNGLAINLSVTRGWTTTGTVQSITATDAYRALTLLVDNTTQTYVLASNAVVTVKDYANATFTDLQSGDKVSIRLVNGTVAQLQAEFVTTGVQGTVEALSSTGTKFVAVRLNNDSVQTYILASYYTLTVEGRTNPTLSDIVVGDRVDVRLHNGLAVNLAVTRGWTATGTVQSTTTTDSYRTLTLLVDDTTQTYVLASNAVITVKDHPAATWADIKAGDKVSLRMVNGTVAQLEAQLTYTTDEGTVIANNNSGDRYIAIQRSNGTSVVYWIAPYYRLTVEGKTNPVLSDIIVGDQVSLKLHDGQIAWITDLHGTTYTGTLTNVVNSSSSRQLTMRLENNTTRSFAVDANATVAIKDQPQATYADLRTGDKVTVRVVTSKVVQIDGEFVYTSVEGNLTNINLSARQVTLQKTTGTQVYTIPATAVLSIPNKTNPTLNDLALGDKVEIKIRNNAVAFVSVTPATAVSGTVGALVNSGSDRAVTIKEADGDLATYALAANATIMIKGQTTANFGSLVVGDLIQIRVIDNKVVRLEAEYAYTTVTGSVTLVDQSSSPKRIYLLPVSGGASQAYSLAASYVLAIDGRTNPTLSNIVVGDQAELKIRAGLVSIITINPLHNQFTATFVRTTTTNNTPGIEFIRNGSVTNITLAANVTLVVPGKTAPTLADLQAGKTIRVTTDNNLATKIEVIQ